MTCHPSSFTTYLTDHRFPSTCSCYGLQNDAGLLCCHLNQPKAFNVQHKPINILFRHFQTVMRSLNVAIPSTPVMSSSEELDFFG